MGFEHQPYNTEDNAKFVSQTTPTKTETLNRTGFVGDFFI